jgi:hypothetical protein
MWSKGVIASPATSTQYQYWVKHFEEKSYYGIDGGRVSKLTIRKAGENRDLCNYDRGWDVEPAGEVKTVYDILIKKFN